MHSLIQKDAGVPKKSIKTEDILGLRKYPVSFGLLLFTPFLSILVSYEQGRLDGLLTSGAIHDLEL